MNASSQILEAFDRLTKEGRAILEQCGYGKSAIPGTHWVKWPDPGDYIRVLTRAVNLVRRACGDNSAHSQTLADIDKDQPINLPSVIGVLEAAKSDFDEGLLFNLKALVEAEILGNQCSQCRAV